MTTRSYHRCTHCGSEYVYQGSGHGAPEYNHSSWCPDCFKDVSDALEARPRLYECRYRDIREIPRFENLSLDTVLGWEAADTKEREARDKTADPSVVRFRRGFFPLFDLKTGDSTETREVSGRGPFLGITFRVSTWRQKADYDITVPMEYDLVAKRFTGRGWPR